MNSISKISVKSRFSRSVNVERDGGANSLEGYIPTGRALDVVRRLAQGMLDPSAGRSLSITGPHGGGKSSLAIFVDALLSGKKTQSYKTAFKLLEEFDPVLANMWEEARESIGVSGEGFYRAVVTAAREPITESILRALNRKTESNSLPLANLEKKLGRLKDDSSGRETLILEFIKEIAENNPFILVIDEFGKNLEAYADSPSESDPFILQGIAEMGQGEKALPIFVMTMQHLSFDDYIQSSSSSQRKEWAKIQGRFQDIPYIDSPIQSRKLISSVFENKSGEIKKTFSEWLNTNKSLLADAGLSDLALTPETLNSFPLHPLTLAVLPQLCSRYGQNERTLFSFLASSERYSVATFLRDPENESSSSELNFVGLDRVYDYFLESAPTMLSASATANRWIEIESRIRDVHGVSNKEEALLKTIGVLNLITSGGNLRASKQVLLLASGPYSNNAKAKSDLEKALNHLEKRGLIVYREFADEYRVWQGSDFDLRSATEGARRQFQSLSLATLLNKVVSLSPVVAGRASQEKGILRVFEQRFFDPEFESVSPLSEVSHFDGIVAYSVKPLSKEKIPVMGSKSRPIVYLIPTDVSKLRELVIETSSLHHVLEAGDSTKLDWVAKRELIERYVSIKQQLLDMVSSIWMDNSKWFSSSISVEALDPNRGLSSVLSEVCDSVYTKSPRVASEMIARRELTGQGTRARRKIIEAMLISTEKSTLGIEGFGPDRAIYEALLRGTGMHAQTDSGEWQLRKPTKMGWGQVWSELEKSLNSATNERLNVYDIYKALIQPPFGLKEGVIPLVLMAAIMSRKSEFALYEHGTLILNLDDAVAERLAKNPSNFAIRNYATSSKSRSLYIDEIVDNFKISNLPTDNSFMAVATALYREIHFLPSYTKNTSKGLSEKARLVRDAFKDAIEPDILFFTTLPQVLGFKPIAADGDLEGKNEKGVAKALFTSFKELRDAYPGLMEKVAGLIAEATATPSDVSKMRLKLAGQANNLEGRVLEKSLNAFVMAILRDSLPDPEWLENLAMVIAEGAPTKTWNDESLERFKGKAQEIGGSIRRLQALLYDRLSTDSEGFDAARVTVTFPNGNETVRIVGISEKERSYIATEIDPVISEFENRFGSLSAAKSALLAWLTSETMESVQNMQEKKERDHG
jgi:hypothetical protein